jgi:hypothetical protein
MKATRFIVEIEKNGGFDFNSLRKDYKKDVSCKDFKAYFTKYLMKNHELTRFIAQKVADYYL